MKLPFLLVRVQYLSLFHSDWVQTSVRFILVLSMNWKRNSVRMLLLLHNAVSFKNLVATTVFLVKRDQIAELLLLFMMLCLMKWFILLISLENVLDTSLMDPNNLKYIWIRKTNLIPSVLFSRNSLERILFSPSRVNSDKCEVL